MNDLLSTLRIKKFETLLNVYQKAGITIRNVLDGGAGWGSTSSTMTEYLPSDGKVYAFEPFPGNHRFFENLDPRIHLVPKALSDKQRYANFMVPSVVSAESEWGKHGMVGYSSVGMLSAPQSDAHCNLQIECVAADEVIDAETPIDFVKLDLQGGELDALKGMSRILKQAKLLWVEFSHSGNGLLEFLIESDYILFDTEYFFLGEPTMEAEALFDVSTRNCRLSTNAIAWFGFKKHPWGDFKTEFYQYKRHLGLVQTDLVCINRKSLAEFLIALSLLAAEERGHMPPHMSS